MATFRSRLANAVRVGDALLRGNPLDDPAVPLSSPAAWMFDLLGGTPTAAGVAVNEHTAMQLATVYACINVLASDFSSLPCRVYETTNGKRKPAVDSDLHYLLTVEPNPEMSAVTFWSTLMGCAALTGNCYARIQREGTKPIALWPLHPRHVRPERQNNVLVYLVTVNGVTDTVLQKDILHVPALTLDGILGLSPIMAAKQTIGTAIASERFGAGFFGRGSRPSGLLTGPMPKSPQEKAAVKASWDAANSGDNQGRTAVLPEKWEWKALSVTPEEAQFLQTQQYTRTQIAGVYRIPPHMVGDTSRLSNSNHESQALEYVTFTLRPWLMRFEAEIQRKLMPRLGQKANKLTVRFDTSELIRGDFASQMNGFAVGKQWGFFNTNQILQKLGEDPIGPEGDVFWAPLNMVPASKLGEEPTSSAGEGSDPEPAGNGGRNQRMLLDRIAAAFAPLFRDAAGRLVKRDKRDAAAVQQIFGPVLAAIAEHGAAQARGFFRLADDAQLGEEKLVRELVKTLERRTPDWTATTVSQDAATALAYCVRSITLNVFREAGSSLALAA